MAIFKKKTTVKAESKKEGAKKKVTKSEKAIVAEVVRDSKPAKAGKTLDLSMILVRPHVTEKATDLSERGVYAFEVNIRANKSQVRQAVEALFKVRPVRVAIIVNKPKFSRNQRTNRVVVKNPGFKKALVYLKKGDKIEFV